MMKRVLSKSQAHYLDKVTTEDFSIQGKRLMGNAGQEVADIVRGQLLEEKIKSVLIICGKGNNGGDGISTALKLKEKLINVHIHLLFEKEKYVGESKYFLDICTTKKIPITSGISIENIDCEKYSIIVDAILGIGFRGYIRPDLIHWVKFINESNLIIISIDIPTGLDADSGLACPIAVKSAITVTMGYEKIGMLVQNGPEFCGKIIIAQIGFPKDALRRIDKLKWYKFNENYAEMHIEKPKLNTNKFKQGRVLIVGGSIGMTGAASLSAMGSLRIGTGLVSIITPRSINAIYENKLTEVITIPVEDKGRGILSFQNLDQIIANSDQADAVIIGPGIGRSESTQKLIKQLILEINKPTVLDADGLNPFNGKMDILNKSNSELVITPHFGEFAKLVDSNINEILNDFPEFMNIFMNNYKHSLLLKQVPACYFSDDNVLINISGNPGLATAGSGDVLSGMIGGLLAAGLNMKTAVPISAFLHGKASDYIVKDKGYKGQIASDIIETIPTVLKKYE